MLKICFLIVLKKTCLHNYSRQIIRELLLRHIRVRDKEFKAICLPDKPLMMIKRNICI